jgi:hypothetical protein|uniref:Uncharacterized protein n=1 Tax=Zea mays TaxID=4577 RepID=A0A804LGL8_MAIZE
MKLIYRLQGTLKAIYSRILNPETSSKKLKREGKDEHVLPTKTAMTVTVEAEDGDLEESPGFGFGNTQRNIILEPSKPPMNLENRDEAKPNGGDPSLSAIHKKGIV